MKTTNLITLVMTLTVGIILAGSLLGPIVEGSSAPTEVKYYNGDGTETYIVETPVKDHTFAYVDATNVSIDGVTYDFDGLTLSRVICSESVFLNSNAGYVCIDNIVNTALAEGWTATYTSGIFSITIGEDTYTSTHTDTWAVIYAGTGGTHVLANTTDGARYVNDISDAIWVRNATSSLVYGIYNGEGWFHAGSSTTSAYTLTPVDGTDFYTVKDASVRNGSNSLTYAFVPTYVVQLIPKDYAPLLQAIMPLIIIALVMGAVAAIYLRRDD